MALVISYVYEHTGIKGNLIV